MRLHRACIFLFMNIVLAKVAREPYCPPCPSCEERLLERFIRNELAMEKLQKEIEIKLNNAIKTAMENISNAVSEMTQNATMTGLQLKKENEILKDQLTIPLIYFYADTPAAYSIVYGQDVVYTNVRVNEGQGYDPKTGLFTVSVPGLYLFTVHYMLGQSAFAYLTIKHQGTNIQPSFHNTVKGELDTFSMQVFIRAAMSDKIWVESKYSDTTLWGLPAYNSFSGALIHM